MRLTYTDLRNQFLRNIGQTGSSDATVINDFNLNLGQRYQTILALMRNYVTQTYSTTTTVAGTQYYSYPPGMVNPETVVVTVGSVNYPMQIITAQFNWDVLNAITVQASARPQFYLPRRDDFGLWPIPQDAYTVTFNYHLRDRSLSIADYTDGTVTVTNASATVTGSGTTFTPAMVGRWFTITDVTEPGQGYWYRIASFTSATVVTLDRTYTGTTGSGFTYRIGQSPEIPDEGHIILADGATADYYGGLRKDKESYTWWQNKFYTGDANNNSRREGDQSIKGGLIGLMNRYSDRNDVRIVNRRARLDPLNYQVWATSLSG